MISYTKGHPFDLTKTRLQTAPTGTYTGALDVVRKTLARDGVKGCVQTASLSCASLLVTVVDIAYTVVWDHPWLASRQFLPFHSGYDLKAWYSIALSFTCL